MWKVLVGRWVEKTVIVGEKFPVRKLMQKFLWKNMKKLQLLKYFSIRKLMLKFGIVGENILFGKMSWKVLIGW